MGIAGLSWYEGSYGIVKEMRTAVQNRIRFRLRCIQCGSFWHKVLSSIMDNVECRVCFKDQPALAARANADEGQNLVLAYKD